MAFLFWVTDAVSRLNGLSGWESVNGWGSRDSPLFVKLGQGWYNWVATEIGLERIGLSYKAKVIDKEVARMGSMITVQMPEDVLIEALRRLPEGRRRAILRQLMGLEGLKPCWVPAAELGRLIGLVSLGGDAVQDTEALYNG